ncbi:MAG: arginine--tRNA ligase [Nitrososphaerota archaeon]|jgi:arginyl-tRNA synthetase|nr:arginine--tRNA ligase [Nitrososphaerota archaeon]
MIASNPFELFRQECQLVLADALEKSLPEIKLPLISLKKTPNVDYGQLATSLCFELAKKLNQRPLDLAEHLVGAVDKSKFNLLDKVTSAGGGYINFHVNFAKFTLLTLQSIKELTSQYGFVKTDTPQKIIVEHTSVNPLHSIHIGQARNPMLGDTLARILQYRGHDVSRHYYIDDVGRQSSVVAYGYSKLGRPKPTEKPDLFVGKIYTVTSCIVEINRLKRARDKAVALHNADDLVKINKDIDDWMSIAAELKEKYPILFEVLLAKVSEDSNPEEEINRLNHAYENGQPVAKDLVREVSNLCLDGFRATMNRINVTYDSWDWESDFVWTPQVSEVMTKLKTTPYISNEKGVLQFNADQVTQTLNLKPKLGLSQNNEIPPLTLVRADGTTLYTTRDIAYTIWKFKHADKVINIIGMEQSLAQLQLKLALYAMGYNKEAENLTHFAYNLITLPGYKMSSRRGHYITLDEVLNEAIQRAYEEVSKRSPTLNEEEKHNIANFVGLGAVRYTLIDIDPSKPVVFTWERVLNFETNSAPYVQYTHARASSILRKATIKPQPPQFGLLSERIEKELVLTLAGFPDTFIEATEYLKPNMVADYVNSLADKFNTFYNAYPVLKADSQDLIDARLTLVKAIQTVMKNALNLIGVVAPEKM